ncbi:MAG: ATPase, T2SS/T4P/T4SS family [Actinomycetota bacterium]|nr:ATPase, T2SS/T4P/T4SS family [Actinomycetota bacterium]
MAETITNRVLDALVGAGLVTVEQLSAIAEAATSGGKTPGDVLLERGMITAGDLTNVLEDELGMPAVDLSSYAPDEEALNLVPVAVAREHNILPLFEIEGMLTVAIGDSLDVFKLDDLGTQLGYEIEAVLADSASVRGAIVDYYGDMTDVPPAAAEVEPLPTPEEVLEEEADIDIADFFEAPAAEQHDEVLVVAEPISDTGVAEAEAASLAVAETIEQVVETDAPAGPPAIDLDVLAVADAKKTSVLVTEILEHAVKRGAKRVHILPYKDDFFLVFRVAGRLEKVASAPLSLQAALIEGIKNFVRLGAVPASLPTLGRLKTHIADKDLVLTVSSVPTVAGQRMVISLSAGTSEPRELGSLGMNEAETRALYAMVERGRGILLVCGPVAGGRSATYYALLSHAARAGKTVYSVERSIDHEIPAVAQVLVNPGSPVSAASYFAAGMRQDTDVMAIDPIQSVEDVHLAVEAAGMGKLVIATFSGGDIVSGVRRMLDLGAEPVSLAAALTLGVGQRLVRLNCPNCSQESRSALADTIPGAPSGMMIRSGTGCPNCRKSGFQGATGIFEVLPFTEPVRARIARNTSAEEIAAAARSAGMRPMVASGLARVQEGLVSPEELNRVLRFAE